MFFGAGTRDSRLRLFACCLLCAACLVFVLTDLHAEVTEIRTIVFAHDPGRQYPELEFECLDAVTIDAFVGNSGHRFHFWSTLTLVYDETLVAPGASVPLTFTLVPFDGEGSEYDLERGLKFNLDCTFYDWGVKYGNDVEGDFVPPLWGEHESLDDMLATIWDKGKWCFGSAAIGLYTVERFDGNEVKIPIYVQNPHNETAVWFDETGTDTIVISFTYRNTAEATLEIADSWVGDITLEAGPLTDPKFIVDQSESLIKT